MPTDKEEQISTTASVSRVDVDPAAFARDKLTTELVFAAIHGRVLVLGNMQGIVDTCRKIARYIQDTNEVTDY